MNNAIFDGDPNLAALRQALDGGQLVVYIGSGLSRGYPSWHELVSKLSNRCLGKVQDELGGETPPSETLLRVAGQARRNNEKEYAAVLAEEFAKPVKEIPRAYAELFSIPFLSYVTPNFDPLLSVAHGASGLAKLQLNVFPEIDPPQLRTGAVFYIHGLITEHSTVDPGRILLTDDDLKEHYDGVLRNFWENLLLHHDVLFIGCGLGEPEIEMVFARCNSVNDAMRSKFKVKPRRRFMMVDGRATQETASFVDESSSPVLRSVDQRRRAAARLERLQIQPVYYDSIDDRYLGLQYALGSLPRRQPVIKYSNTLSES